MNYLASMQQCGQSETSSPIKVLESETSLTMLSDSSEICLSTSSTISSTSSTSLTSSLSLSSISSDDMGFCILSMSQEMSDMDEKILLKSHGYTEERQLGTTTQGEIILATRDEQFVVIKKIEKDLHQRKEFMENDFTFNTDKNIVKETMILKSITENKDPKNELIVTYIDAFESNEFYYLVEECVEESITLKQFVLKAHEYIKEGKLKLKKYKKCIKLVLYQLAVVLNALHTNHKCCHLDICPDNVLVTHSDFIQSSDGSMNINPNIQIKLKDFGLSEQFEIDDNTFECNKQFLSIETEQYLCPDAKEKVSYDGRQIDLWAYGMTVFFCYVGSYPYETMEFTNDLMPKPRIGSGYWAVLNGKLKKHLSMSGKLKFVNANIMSLINKLLDVNQSTILDSDKVLKHELFSNARRL